MKPRPESATDKVLEDRARLYRQYRAARQAARDALYREHPCGHDLQTFEKHLISFTIDSAAPMLAYIREMARGWLAAAPPEIRAEALSIVDERIIRIRMRAGLPAIDDALPGEADDVFTACRRELA